MKFSAKTVSIAATALLTAAIAAPSFASTESNILANAPGLSPAAVKTALKAYNEARAKGMDPQQIFTIVDFAKPSTAKRMWVIDMKNDKVLFNTLVAQGKNSGLNYATHFSNRHGTDESSLGLYKTANTYYGHDGFSLRIDGLTKGYNTNALSRDVVMHPAWYVSENFIKREGRLGRSWGCFALNKKIEKQVVNTVKNGTLIFAYAPKPAFVHSSSFVSA